MIGRGLGLIASSNFYVPQVNLPGSMASFVTPAGIPVVAVGQKSGLGQTEVLSTPAPPSDPSTQFLGSLISSLGGEFMLPFVIGGVLLLIAEVR